MNILQAKKTAKRHGFDLYYDRQQKLWICTTPDLRPLNFDGNSAFYLSPGQLFSLTVEKFEQFYLNRAN